jgi:hypothetical protein
VGALGGLGRARRARVKPKQQNEAIIQTNAQSHKRVNKQKPANPRLEETKANRELK